PSVLRHGPLLEGCARAAVQDGGRRPVSLRHRAPRRRHGDGSAHRAMARRDALHDRSDRLVERCRQEEDLRGQCQAIVQLEGSGEGGCMTTTRARLVLVAILGVFLAAVWPRAQSLQKVTINYPTRSGASWPLYIAKEGGYYQKYGLDVDLQFGVHPAGIAMLTSGQAVMVNHSLEQGMVASSKDAANFQLMGSSSNKGLFALIAQKEFTSPKQLKGKRIAVGQIGDAPYNYTVALLGTFGLGVRDVQW